MVVMGRTIMGGDALGGVGLIGGEARQQGSNVTDAPAEK
jgi:hypothetical protein